MPIIDPLNRTYEWREGAWTAAPMSSEPPLGLPTDFAHLTPFEREKRKAMMEQGVGADDGFAEVVREKEREQKAREERARLERERAAAAAMAGARTFHLLCAKKADKTIHVVGMYSTREGLAQAIAEGVGAYAAAGMVFGTVDFNLGIKVDQPPVPPSP